MIKHIFLNCLIFFSAGASQAGSMCVDIFSIKNGYQNLFFQSDFSGKYGYVWALGINEFSRKTDMLGGIEYSLKEETLKLLRVIDRPELYGMNIYRQLMEQILLKHKNDGIKKIVITLDSRFLTSEKIKNNFYLIMNSLSFTEQSQTQENINNQAILMTVFKKID